MSHQKRIRVEAPGESEFTLDVPQTQVVRYDATATEALANAELRAMVEHAHKFPRQMRQCIQDLHEMATQDEETAARCFYTLPARGEGNKEITGPSIRFAELLFSAFPHLHSEESFIGEEERFIVVRVRVYDCQMNRGAARVVRRRIVGKSGKRYNEDMIENTVRAAFSIAFRNAMLRVIPPAFWGAVFNDVMTAACGNKENFKALRDKAIEWYEAEGGISEERLLAFLRLPSKEALSLRHLRMLRGMATGLKEGNLRWSMFDTGERVPSSDAAPVEPGASQTQHEANVGSLLNNLGGGT